MRRLYGIIFASICGCSLATDLDGLKSTSDGGTAPDARADGPTSAPGFKISAAPDPVRVGPNQSDIITVDVIRNPGFVDAVLLSVNNLPANVTASPITVTGVGGSLNVGASGAIAGEYDIVVVGTAGTQTATAPLHLHVGGKLAAFDQNGSFNVPLGNPKLIVKLWGGGGAGAGTGGGSGGGGGYAEDTIDVTPGESLDVDVGTGGQPSNNEGGGGGGFSAVRRSGTILVQAGGGGGGGMSCSGVGGKSGGAGGGTTGENGAGGANGGTQTSGAAVNQGGNNNGGGAGGVPGGGTGGSFCGGGGGGGGKYGGKSGNQGRQQSNSWNAAGGDGGGGGSAMVGPQGKSATGVGATPGAMNDPDLTGFAQGGAVGKAGAHGRVVVYLP